MCSTLGPNKENYEFFEKIEDYIKIVNSAESNAPLSKAENNVALPKALNKCNSFMEASVSHFTFKSTAKNICEQFVKLYYSLTDLNNCVSSNDPDYKKCSEFLNYWVNFKLRESMKNKDDCVNDVYDTLESQITGSVDFYINLDFLYIYDIKKNDLYNMNILYNLYDKYSKLKTIIEDNWLEKKQQILTLSTQCCTDYIKASYMCNNDNKDNNPIFCEKLNIFKSKYEEEIYKKVNQKGSDFSNHFVKLEECPNTKIITTAVTGSIVGLIPLLGVLYKFTPMGQVLRSKMGILNNDIGKNDEEMTNISLMEQENEQLRFQKGTYNIKYQSL